MINPEMDGIDHINIYSKGKTELGRFLTNFAHTPINTVDGKFESIEGYWYWLSCKDDRLRHVYGFRAKALGRELGGKDWMDTDEFKNKIKAAIDQKLMYSRFQEELVDCDLPLKHYYVYGGKVVEPKDGKWILEHIESWKDRCSTCGTDQDVSYVPEPFAQEIYNKCVMRNLCKHCYRESCMDI